MTDHFGRWLRTQIGKRGEKKSHFAKRAGIPRSTLNEWLKAPWFPIVEDNIQKLAAGLGLPYEEVESALDSSKLKSIGPTALGQHEPWPKLNGFQEAAIVHAVPLQQVLDEALVLWREKNNKKEQPVFTGVVDVVGDEGEQTRGRITERFRREKEKHGQTKRGKP